MKMNIYLAISFAVVGLYGLIRGDFWGPLFMGTGLVLFVLHRKSMNKTHGKDL